MDGGASWATVHGVAKSQTQLWRRPHLLEFKGFPVAQLVKNPPAMLETRFDPWVGHGVYGPWSRKESDTTE